MLGTFLPDSSDQPLLFLSLSVSVSLCRLRSVSMVGHRGCFASWVLRASSACTCPHVGGAVDRELFHQDTFLLQSRAVRPVRGTKQW
mmetsp:Transcript_40855/g.108297  ORF Transcript_40855/g.108297 Transcript_40855/m.108297 type:complete len:87 (+) Transcript_40855:244-504(+)